MNKFTKALLLALVVTAPVATFAPTVQAKQVMNQQKVAQTTTSPQKPKKRHTSKKPATKPNTSSTASPTTSASPSE